MRALTLEQAVKLANGTLAGAPSQISSISGTCSVDNYVKDNVTFVKNRKYGRWLASLDGAVVLLLTTLASLALKFPQNTYILVDDVLESMMDLQDHYHGSPTRADATIASTATLHETAQLGRRVHIGDHVWVDRDAQIDDDVIIMAGSQISAGVALGPNTLIHPGVTIYPGCRVGRDCIVHSGARIGADGFRFEHNVELKRVRKWPHAGSVVIGDRVEIGANATVDRATFPRDATTLEDDVKLSDQVHVGHNSRIGARTIVAGPAVVTGSVTIGEDVRLSPGSVISNGLTVGSRAQVLINAVVVTDVADDEVVSGFYAMPHLQWLRAYRNLRGNS